MRKRIPNYEDYFIYDNGDVLNTKTNKMLKGSIGEHGYRYYRLSKNNVKKMFYAHRLVAENFLMNDEDLPVVNHKDGNKLNNNVDNLEWITYSKNTEHAYSNKLIVSMRKREYYKEDLLDEIWKKVPNYNYSVSNLGRIRNDKTLLLLKPSLTCGYNKVRLSNNGIVSDIMVHKLVYCVFNEINDIPEGYVIDHINANKTDNSLKNLRLITLSENVKSALYVTKTNSSCKKVEQLTLTDIHIAFFDSCAEAARTLGLDPSTISKVCRGTNKSHGGFHFKYVE
ncbi:MAG: HNH endonuclease [Clostridium sp.]|nr:HNH endonuclease [Clostridium sp.]